jgi:tRNA(Ile2) C34 agmatinyltransferase TiaS
MKSVEELVAKLRQGKVIRMDKVIEESTWHKVFVFLVSMLTQTSDEKSARCRYCGYVDENVLEVPAINATD